MVSRRQVAAEVAQRLRGERRQMVQQAAAWLVTSGKPRQARYLARDVAAVLADDGYVLTEVTTAQPLPEHTSSQVVGFVKKQLGAREVELDPAVDVSVIGGVRVSTPAATLDATVRTKLSNYVEGVTN